MTLAKREPYLHEDANVGSDGLGLIAYGFFLGYAGSECYGMLVSNSGTTFLFGWVIGAAAALVLAGNLQLSGRFRTFDLIVNNWNIRRSPAIRMVTDIVGVVILISIALYVREFPGFARNLAAQTIATGLALMILPTAMVIVTVRLAGTIARMGRALLRVLVPPRA